MKTKIFEQCQKLFPEWAALPLAVEPIQKIRFIPYAHQRFTNFLKAYDRINASPTNLQVTQGI